MRHIVKALFMALSARWLTVSKLFPQKVYTSAYINTTTATRKIFYTQLLHTLCDES